MTVVVSVEEASSHLPELLLRLTTEAPEIVIARDGTPIARLLPAPGLGDTARPRRVPGGDRGLFTVPAEFFEPLPEDLLDSIYDDARP
jgi:antitoxin (DNA-binding transcriptional repressor) of toxin-antitoxin stability system